MEIMKILQMKTLRITEQQFRKITTKQPKILKEYIGNQMIYLRDYLNMSDEQKKESLPYEFPYLLADYFNSYGEEDSEYYMWNQIYNEMDDGSHPDFEDYEYVEHLKTEHPDLYDTFAEWLFDGVINGDLHDSVPHQDYPAWSFLSDPKLIKNQWLIHFTNYATEIARDGFKYGVEEMSKLGLTTSLGDFEKKYGGYNFAYTLGDFHRYGYKGGARYSYGKQAVIFRASGIQLWHSSDNEPQVIFYGNTAKNIIPITEGDKEEWGIKNKITGRFLYQFESLPSVVNWLTKNYNQYKNVI